MLTSSFDHSTKPAIRHPYHIVVAGFNFSSVRTGESTQIFHGIFDIRNNADMTCQNSMSIVQ